MAPLPSQLPSQTSAQGNCPRPQPFSNVIHSNPTPRFATAPPSPAPHCLFSSAPLRFPRGPASLSHRSPTPQLKVGLAPPLLTMGSRNPTHRDDSGSSPTHLEGLPLSPAFSPVNLSQSPPQQAPGLKGRSWAVSQSNVEQGGWRRVEGAGRERLPERQPSTRGYAPRAKAHATSSELSNCFTPPPSWESVRMCGHSGPAAHSLWGTGRLLRRNNQARTESFRKRPHPPLECAGAATRRLTNIESLELSHPAPGPVRMRSRSPSAHRTSSAPARP